MRFDLLNVLADDFLAKVAKPKIKYTEFEDGIAICADSTEPETFEFVKKWLDGKKVQLLHVDPPYFVLGKSFQGDNTSWDQTNMTQQEAADWMKSWLKLWLPLMHKGAALYIWNGIGTPKFRPFFVFCSQIENEPDTNLTIANIITWRKKRAFGGRNYLFIREECCYIIFGNDGKPRVFNTPLTDQLRGYEGFGKYKAKSPYLRRGNIWEITELFQGKRHPTQKPTKLIKIPIEASSNKNEYVLDLFGGSGSTAITARECGRKFIIIEKDPTYYKNIIKSLK